MRTLIGAFPDQHGSGARVNLLREIAHGPASQGGLGSSYDLAHKTVSDLITGACRCAPIRLLPLTCREWFASA
jgi:hypothetical protein